MPQALQRCFDPSLRLALSCPVRCLSYRFSTLLHRPACAGGLVSPSFSPTRFCHVRRYPAWFLAAVLIAGYMVVFTYGRAVYWSDSIADCIEQPSDCINDVAGR